MKAIITVGMGYGDEGKGKIVAYLTKKYNSQYNVFYSGGFQRAHNIVEKDKKHTFSQFGSGTFFGAKTYHDRDCIIDPLSLVQEAKHLESLGVCNPLDLVSFHPDCLVSTQYHLAVNRAKERFREKGKKQRHGSCGLGIGETRRLWSQYDACVRALDLSNNDELIRKLFRIRDIMGDTLNDLNIPFPEEWPTSPYDVFKDLIAHKLQISEFFISGWVRHFDEGKIIFEGSQGILLDQHYGVNPHTTWSDVTPRNAVELCNYLNLEYETCGVTRTYLTRHGAGPLNEFEYGIKDEYNPSNDWQGYLRSGPLNLTKLKEGCDKFNIDYLAVNHEDQIPRFQEIHRTVKQVKYVGFGPSCLDVKEM